MLSQAIMTQRKQETKRTKGKTQMNEALIDVIKDLEKQGVIKDLEKHLESVQSDIDYYHKKLRECDEKAINLKETIAELKAMKTVMA